MKITALGAASGEVTGSAYLIETDQASVLVDCGMIQGEKDADSRNRSLGLKSADKVDAVVLTHAHLDHCGRLPLLHKSGYSRRIHATPAAAELAGLILRDSAKIQAHDLVRVNRKRERAGKPPEETLYSAQDVEETLQLLAPTEYKQEKEIAPGVTATFIEAGHMLGSACVKITLSEEGRRHSIVFSGDLGPKGAPILRDAEQFAKADTVVMESTYGDRDHRNFDETVEQFFSIVKESVASGGKVLVPTFAVGRAQLLLMLLAWAFRKKMIKPFPVFLDSPMAIEANNIYMRHTELFDEDMMRFMSEGSLQQDLATLNLSPTAEESKKINDVAGPAMIMAGAGMCTAGRILHHFKQHLWRPGTHVLIVGFQARGSLGRLLVEGTNMVRIYGEEIAVRAKVHTLGGFSAHAGKTDLLNWLEPLAKGRPRVVLTHGEDGPRRSLAASIKQRYDVQPLLPSIGEEIIL